MWRNSIAGNRDLWLAMEAVATGGFTAQKLGMGSWTLNACPMDGGDILSLGSERLRPCGSARVRVYYCAPGGMEVGLGKGKQPGAVQVSGRPLVVFGRKAVNLVMTRDAGTVAAGQSTLTTRVLHLSYQRAEDHAVLAYEQGKAGESRIVMERL
jgi:hypothetical protein